MAAKVSKNRVIGPIGGIVVASTDGVGTKLKIAETCNIHNTIGIDLVAMCVNDVLANGAQPLFFLDYLAYGEIKVDIVSEIIEGIKKGCQLAGCEQIEGKCANIPAIYAPHVYDLAGFTVGALEPEKQFPRVNEIVSGDVVIGIASSGLHSNGFSLVRKVFEHSGLDYGSAAPFNPNKTLGEELLTPTKIYCKTLLPAISSGRVKAYAHITGGGLLENIPRVLPSDVCVHLDATNWPVHPVFGWLSVTGNIPTLDMLRTFNCGLGAVLIVSSDEAQRVISDVQEMGELAWKVGSIMPFENGEPRVKIINFEEALQKATIQFDGKQDRSHIGHREASRISQISLTYQDSGVDIDAGNSLVEAIKPMAATTLREGVIGSIGGFGGLFDLSLAGYKDSYLKPAADGVGTKLKIAQDCNIHNTVGIDLVAKCVNGVLAKGAEPLFLLDYLACGKINVDVASQVIKGVKEGCQLAGCALIGGESAEMPGVFAPNVYDLVGFVVGALQQENQFPRVNEIVSGDVVIGIASSGLHCNGFSLVRKVVERSGLDYGSAAPFNSNKTLGEELLTPTKIYCKTLLPAIRSGRAKSYAHITRGGLLENIPQVLPSNVGVHLDARNWPVHPVFGWLSLAGNIPNGEMLRTFNCGLGAVLIVGSNEAQQVISDVQEMGELAWKVGSIIPFEDGEPRVNITNFQQALDKATSPFSINIPSVPVPALPSKKRIAVLLSGNGTNLQAIMDYTRDPINQSTAEVVLVISNNGEAKGIQRAKKVGIETKVINHKEYKSRLEFDMVLNKELNDARVDIVCLAGFMRILTGELVQLWKGRMLNIHPSLLPLFKGTHAIKQALDAGAQISGCSVHFVTEEVDAGCVLVQEVVPIEIGDTEDVLEERIHQAEYKAYPRALELLSSGKVVLNSEGKLSWST